MHNFLRKIVTHYTKLAPLAKTHHRAFHSHAHNSLSSLPKPSLPQIPQSNYIFFKAESGGSSFLLHHFHALRSGSAVFARYFMLNSSNALFRVSCRGVGGCRPKLLMRAQFHGQSFDVNRTFRSARGIWRSWFQRLTNDGIVLGLIIANVAVFLAWRVADPMFMSENFTLSLYNVRCGRLHTLVTSAFSHIDVEHIISNMIGLYFFGNNIGRVFGPEYLLKLYLAGAVGGSVFYLVHQAYKAQTSKGRMRMDYSRGQTLGASGAVNAILLLDIFLFPKSTLYFNLIIPVPAILLGIFLVGKDVLRIIEGDTRISGSAHLGGAAVAAIAWARIRKGRF